MQQWSALQQWLALLRSQCLTALLSVHTAWGFSAASCGSHCRPSEESRSLVCVGLQCCSQRAAWPLSAALSYLSQACPDSQPGLPRHKGGLVLRETGVSNPPPPSSSSSRQMPAVMEPHILSSATWKEGWPQLHQRVRALMSDMELPPEETVPVQEHYRQGLRPDWLTHWLTALLCPLRNGDERLSWRGLTNTNHTQPCSRRITCSFVCIVVSLYRLHVF